MQTKFIVLLGLVLFLAYAMRGQQRRAKPAWTTHLKGWQKVFGAIAVLGTVLMILNPEFFALGILGDTVFFEMFVLALTLQLHTFATRFCRSCVALFVRGMRSVGCPSAGLVYSVAVLKSEVRRASASIRSLTRRLGRTQAMA